MNPYCFEPPIAPHIAADQAGVEIELAHITCAYRSARRAAPIASSSKVSAAFASRSGRISIRRELARELRLPVVLVVGMRLGCLNHALLTAEAIRNAGLRLAGWVANHIDPEMAYADENVMRSVRTPQRAHRSRAFRTSRDDAARLAAAHVDRCAALITVRVNWANYLLHMRFLRRAAIATASARCAKFRAL